MSNNPYLGEPQPNPYSIGAEFTNPSPYSPESLLADGGWRTLAGQVYEMDFPDPAAADDEDEDETPLQHSEGLPRTARRGGIKYPSASSPGPARHLPLNAGIVNAHHADNLEERDTVPPTVWTDDDEVKPVTTRIEKDGLMVPLQKLTAETLHDTSVTTAEYLYAPSTIDYLMAGAKATGVPLTEEQARKYLRIEQGRVSGASITLPGGGMGEIRATPLPSGHRVEEVTLEVPVSHDKLSYALAAVENVIAGRRAFGYTIPEESRTVTTVGNEIVIRWEEHS